MTPPGLSDLSLRVPLARFAGMDSNNSLKKVSWQSVSTVDTPSISINSLASLAMVSEASETSVTTEKELTSPSTKTVVITVDDANNRAVKTQSQRTRENSMDTEKLSAGDATHLLHGSDSYISTLSERARKKSVLTLEDEVTRDKLTLLAEIFADASATTDGKLDMRHFKWAMRETGTHMSDEQLEMTFMKVDTNCDMTVEWDEYVSYMLLECLEKDQMNARKMAPFPEKARRVPSDHHHGVVRILLLPQILASRDPSIDNKVVNTSGGSYVAVDSAGIVTFWSMRVTHKRTREVQVNSVLNRSNWITDMTSLPASQLLVFSTMESELQFYDIVLNKFKRISRIVYLPACPVTLHFYESSFSDKQRLLWGDIKGGIGIIVFTESPRTVLINKMSQRRALSFLDIVHGAFDGLLGHYAAHVHSKMVRQIKYSELLSSVISVARSTDRAMFIGDLEKTSTPAYFNVYRGVNSVDYCSRTNTVATGGQDAVVRIWNPYMTAQPVSLLYGHESPVQQVHMNSANQWVVSIGKNLEVRVHDMTTQVCVQTVHRRAFPGHTGPFAASFLSPFRQALLLATQSLFVLEHADEDKVSRGALSHTAPVKAALHNPLFRQVVSACAASTICVWSLPHGNKVMQFQAVSDSYGDDKAELTTICFDPTLRRLITASEKGVVAIWNFNNGACLQKFPRYTDKEITSLETGRCRIFAGGWSRTIVVFLDGDESEETIRESRPAHDDDLLAMTACPPDMLASASQDGAIFLWSLTSWSFKFALNTPTIVSYPTDDLPRERQEVTDAVSLKYSDEGESMSSSNVVSSDTYDLPGQPPEVADAVSLKDVDKGESSSQSTVVSNDTDVTPPADTPRCSSPVDSECPRPVFSTPIEKLLFLPARDRGHDTASLLAAGSDGVVRAWCISAPGSYVGGFTASHHPDESVPAMAVDETNDLLVTGDACGYVKVWDISHFAVRERHCCDEEHRKRDAVWRDFPLLRWIKRLEEMGTGTLHKAFPTMQTAHEHDQPHLLTSVRAHVACINSVEYASLRSDERFILTASDDHSVRMWSLRGQFMGLFGQPALWDLNRTLCLRSERKEYMRHRPRSYLLPPDVRRCASTTTLRTLNNFKKTTWRGLACIVSCAQQFLEAGKRYREIDRPASVGKSSQSVHLKELPTPVLGHNFPRLPRHFTAKVARPVIFGHLCPAFHSIPLPAVEYVDFTPYTNMLKATRDRYQFSQHARLPPIRTGHGNPQRQALTRRYTVTHGHVGDHGHPGDHGHVRVHGHGHGHARMVGHAGDHDHAGDRGPPYDHDYAGAHGDTGAYGHAGDNAQRH